MEMQIREILVLPAVDDQPVGRRRVAKGQQRGSLP